MFPRNLAIGCVLLIGVGADDSDDHAHDDVSEVPCIQRYWRDCQSTSNCLLTKKKICIDKPASFSGCEATFWKTCKTTAGCRVTASKTCVDADTSDEDISECAGIFFKEVCDQNENCVATRSKVCIDKPEQLGGCSGVFWRKCKSAGCKLTPQRTCIDPSEEDSSEDDGESGESVEETDESDESGEESGETGGDSDESDESGEESDGSDDPVDESDGDDETGESEEDDHDDHDDDSTEESDDTDTSDDTGSHNTTEAACGGKDKRSCKKDGTCYYSRKKEACMNNADKKCRDLQGKECASDDRCYLLRLLKENGTRKKRCVNLSCEILENERKCIEHSDCMWDGSKCAEK